MLLQDKVVVVSGIGPGLGMELSTECARQGARAVVLAARTAARLEQAEAEIQKLGGATRVLRVPTDISDREQCRRLADTTVAEFGRIDCLLNSAFNPGTYHPIDEADLAHWRRTMDVNFFGSIGLTQECVRHMKRQKSGSVVMIGTMVEHKPLAYQGGYAASKAAPARRHQAFRTGTGAVRDSLQQLQHGLDVGAQRAGLRHHAGQGRRHQRAGNHRWRHRQYSAGLYSGGRGLRQGRHLFCLGLFAGDHRSGAGCERRRIHGGLNGRMTMSEQTQTEINTALEAAVFRRLLQHLDSRKDVQNIELMQLAGFCRNCLSKWYVAAAQEAGHDIDLAEAREMVYGMPYAQWKQKYQTEATPEQLAAFDAHSGKKD